MSDDVFYIRTGDKISRPFKIGFFAKFIFITFILYTIFITFQYFRISWLEKEIEITKAATQAKYDTVKNLDKTISQINELNVNYSQFEKTVKQIVISTEENHAKPGK